MTELTERFGDVVAQVRSRRGLSQENLGDLANLHRDTIRRIESNKFAKGGPRLETVESIARGLNMLPSELIGLADGAAEVDDDDEER